MTNTRNLEIVLNWMRIYGMLYLEEDKKETVRKALAEFDFLKHTEKRYIELSEGGTMDIFTLDKLG